MWIKSVNRRKRVKFCFVKSIGFPLLFFILFANSISCQQSYKTLNSLPYTTKPYPIKTGFDGTNIFFTYTMNDTDSGEFLYYYDHFMKKITVVDFQQRKTAKHFWLENPQYKIKGVLDLYLNDSSIILQNSNWFYWLNHNGDIICYKYAQKFKGMKFAENSGFSRDKSDYSFSFDKPVQHHQSQNPYTVEFAKFPGNYDGDFYQKSRIAKVYLLSDSLVYSKAEYPAKNYRGKGMTFGFRSNTSLLRWEDKIYMNFVFTPDVYVYSTENLQLLNSHTFTQYEGLKTNRPMSHKRFMALVFEEFIHDLPIDQEEYYFPLYYDPFRNLYYRMARPALADHESAVDFSLWFLIFDADLNLLGKFDLAKEFFPQIFISKRGVYIRKKLQKENIIDLHQLQSDVLQ